MKKSLTHLLGALVVAGALAGCGGSNNNLTPTVVATPTPTPTPTQTATPTTLSCGLAAMPDCAAPEGPRGVFGCCRQRTDELGEFVELAIRQVQATRPELFDGDRIVNGLRDTELIQQLIVRTLEQRFGLCAKITSDDEIGVKRTNDFSEQYDVIIGDGLAVNLHGYTVTCRPARF